MGGMLGSVYATNLGCRVIFGYMGWRFVFVTVAALSMMFGLLVFGVARDPRCGCFSTNESDNSIQQKVTTQKLFIRRTVCGPSRVFGNRGVV